MVNGTDVKWIQITSHVRSEALGGKMKWRVLIIVAGYGMIAFSDPFTSQRNDSNCRAC